MRIRAELVLALLACEDDGALPRDAGLDGTGDVQLDSLVADVSADANVVAGDSVLQRNNHLGRDGMYLQPTFTMAGIASLTRDIGFDGTVSGNVYAQPLFVDNGVDGKSLVIVATENNQVTALASDTGAVVWQRTLVQNAGDSGAGCGNISPIGITSTPTIDPKSRTLFVDAVRGDATSITEHEIHALSVDDGFERAHFPVNASLALSQGTAFSQPNQNQRGALLWLADTLYVTYGGHAGDCGQFHGWILGVPYPNPTNLAAYAFASATRGAGIWAPGGPSSDGTDIFVSTGNAFGASTWVGQEAVLRFHAGLAFPTAAADYWSPHDWLALDNGDLDIGGTGALLIDVPGAVPSHLAIAMGKNGYVYLLDRENLGGVSSSPATDGVFRLQVATQEIVNVPASVTTSTGTWVIFLTNGGIGLGCKTGSGDLVALKISATSPPTASVEWCADSQAAASPMITTSDGSHDAIVWESGAHLLGWSVDTGQQIYSGTDLVTSIRRYNTGIAAKGRMYVAADGKVYAFKQ